MRKPKKATNDTQRQETNEPPEPPKLPPWMDPQKRWTVDEILTMCLETVGNQVKRLHLQPYVDSQELADYAKAAVAIAADLRAAADAKHLKNLKDLDMEKLIANTFGKTLEEVRAFLGSDRMVS